MKSQENVGNNQIFEEIVQKIKEFLPEKWVIEIGTP